MPLPIEGALDEEYEESVAEYKHLYREYQALARIKRKNRSQNTRYMRLKKDILPRINARIAALQNRT
ncbi:MAG: hypothetical protein AAB533_00105 [Patescibacteria group bacterium]